MSLSHQDSYSSTTTHSDSKGSKTNDPKENFSERESVMTFHEEFFRHHQQQPVYLDDSSQSQDTYQLSENEGITDRLLDDITSGRLPEADSPDLFYCTLPVIERHGATNKETIGINAARRKQQKRMTAVYHSDCSTLSSNRTMNASPSVDIGDTCGCFQRLGIGVVRPSYAVSPIPYNRRSKSDGRLATSIGATETSSSCCFAMYNTQQQNTSCVSPPSAVQTFSFADTKIGNAVSQADGGLVVRVNSCRGGQHQVDDRFNEESMRGIHDGLSLFISGKKQEGTSWWRKSKTTSSSGPESDLTGNFTLVSRRCTEVRRAFAYSRQGRWPQLTTECNGRPSSTCESRDVAATEQPSKVGRNSISSVTIGSAASSAWRRLVAGLEVAAVDGRRLLGNCRHAGDTVGLLSLSSGRSYDVLTRNMA